MPFEKKNRSLKMCFENPNLKHNLKMHSEKKNQNSKMCFGNLNLEYKI